MGAINQLVVWSITLRLLEEKEAIELSADGASSRREVGERHRAYLPLVKLQAK